MTQQTDDFLTDGEVSLADLENTSNPVLERVKDRLLKQQPATEPRMAHNSHSSSPAGKGHTSYVNGRFEDSSQ